MTYVHLNPFRASMASDLPNSDHTSAQPRTRWISQDRQIAGLGKPVARLCTGSYWK
ncbi:MAG: hypothetical protein KDI71_03955 [Xanthomonadales bacterium]|nr:hypothetical protein [Xanthomonadales bacterium]